MKKRMKLFLALGLMSTVLLSQAFATPGILEEKEKQNLLYLREEEKLARDLYTVFYEKWRLRPFFNIQQAEQRHMDAIKFHIDAYGLKDPITTDEPGRFANLSVQKSYDQLLARGLKSAQDAIEAGVTIEETSIEELRVAIKESDEPGLNQTYTQLLEASQNHLQAFKRWRGR